MPGRGDAIRRLPQLLRVAGGFFRLPCGERVQERQSDVCGRGERGLSDCNEFSLR